MAAPFDLNDDSVVVIIGTGAGGGTLANELAQKGVSVVALEAGGRYLPEDYVNDEWESFGQLAWLDMRTTSGDWRVARDFPGLPGLDRQGGRRHHDPLRRRQPALPGPRVEGADQLRPRRRGKPPRLADRGRRDGALVRQGRGQDGRHPYRRPARPAGQQQLQGLRGRGAEARLQGGQHRPHGDQLGRLRRPHGLPADRLLLPGLQVGRQVVDGLHRVPAGEETGNLELRDRRDGAPDRA